jgi:hypothetical protein
MPACAQVTAYLATKVTPGSSLASSKGNLDQGTGHFSWRGGTGGQAKGHRQTWLLLCSHSYRQNGDDKLTCPYNMH